MNKKRIGIVLIVLLTIIVSCKTKEVKKEVTKNVVNSKIDTVTLSKDQEKYLEDVVKGNENLNKGAKNFEITSLEGWEKKSQSLKGLLSTVIFAPKKDGVKFRENVNVVTEKVAPDMDLHEYATNAKVELSKFNKFVKLADDEIELNGLHTHRIIFTHNLQNIDFKMEQYFIIDNNIAYVITCTATQQTFDNMKSDFDKIVNSFQLVDAKK